MTDTAAAVVTQVGLLYCARCAARLDVTGTPVYGPPHDEEECEACGGRVKVVA